MMQTWRLWVTLSWGDKAGPKNKIPPPDKHTFNLWLDGIKTDNTNALLVGPVWVRQQCVGVTADWSNVIHGNSESLFQRVAKTEWATPENRKAFMREGGREAGRGQAADNSSTLPYLNSFIPAFTT